VKVEEIQRSQATAERWLTETSLQAQPVDENCLVLKLIGDDQTREAWRKGLDIMPRYWAEFREKKHWLKIQQETD
jgi:hypothetical protein